MSFQTNNLTAGFIDLATSDQLESKIYGGDEAVTYFVRQHKKSTWFTQVPVVLTNASGSGDFGNQWSVTVSRAGDYLLQAWLEVVLPKYTNTVSTSLSGVRILCTTLLRSAPSPSTTLSLLGSPRRSLISGLLSLSLPPRGPDTIR